MAPCVLMMTGQFGADFACRHAVGVDEHDVLIHRYSVAVLAAVMRQLTGAAVGRPVLTCRHGLL